MDQTHGLGSERIVVDFSAMRTNSDSFGEDVPAIVDWVQT